MARRPGRRIWARAMCEGARQVRVADRLGAQRDAGLDPVAGQLAAGGGHGHAGDGDAGHGLGPLDGLGDGLGRLVHVDDGAAAHAARLDIADARDAGWCGRRGARRRAS